MATGTHARTNRRTDDPILTVRDATVTFEMARGRATALDGVSIDVARGETLAVIGESGSGKSTFGSLLMGAVEEPGTATGEVTYRPADGREPVDVLGLEGRRLRQLRWEEVAMVSQAGADSFNPTISVRRHFTETFDAHSVPRETGLERARELLSEFDLDPERVLDAYQHELSGGERQRTQLALALVFDPAVLVVDEPTAGLDLLVQQKILRQLADVRDERDLSVVLISHDVPVVAGLADRVAVMYAFEFVEVGTTRDVLLNPEHPYTRLLSQANIDPGVALDDVRTLEGDPPDPLNVPPGCPFHARCPVADERCTEEVPELRADDAGRHSVACFYPDLAVDQIRFSAGDPGGDDQ